MTENPPVLRRSSPPIWSMVVGIPVVVGLGRWGLLRFEHGIHSVSPGCLFHRLTGWDCPGCGATRSTFALLKGDFLVAWRMNPLFCLLLLAGLITLLAMLHARSRGLSAARLRVGPRMLWMFLWVLVAFGIFRNIPAWPFSLLAIPK